MEKTNICSLCFDFKRNKNVDIIEKKKAITNLTLNDRIYKIKSLSLSLSKRSERFNIVNEKKNVCSINV